MQCIGFPFCFRLSFFSPYPTLVRRCHLFSPMLLAGSDEAAAVTIIAAESNQTNRPAGRPIKPPRLYGCEDIEKIPPLLSLPTPTFFLSILSDPYTCHETISISPYLSSIYSVDVVFVAKAVAFGHFAEALARYFSTTCASLFHDLRRFSPAVASATEMVSRSSVSSSAASLLDFVVASRRWRAS